MPETGRPETLLGFDFGMKRIGVAVGNGVTRTAQPLLVLPAQDGVPDWTRIAALVAEWQPTRLVVGLPLNMDGSESDMSALARRFSRKLHGRIPVPVDMVDERLSSREAHDTLQALAQAGIRRRPRDESIDAHAAALIVETWFSLHDAG